MPIVDYYRVVRGKPGCSVDAFFLIADGSGQGNLVKVATEIGINSCSQFLKVTPSRGFNKLTSTHAQLNAAMLGQRWG